MSVFLNTLDKSVVSVAICDRCKMKRPWVDLASDPNSPGIRACKDTCIDKLDPWRLPPRAPESVNLDFPRPDEPLTA